MVKLESDSSDGDIPMTTKDRIDELFSDRLSEDDLKYILEKKLNLNSFNGVAFNNKAKEIPISKGMTPEHAGKIINESVELLKKKGIEV
ncbi:hypothetical protein WICANDRAFT_62091 [Wickerhamomyces anomalus NRRL Y-366-8]|uniref:Uncharacterized protein n=1 Tax=Wickerhamomyces anomalus (strain ATCC 58044 / CBS 1984 / NCYC 433 / NRRL Y-366-8) TaxID=683960 RepID=A0A1E3P2F6_WICAA|nr:uncharacterized protein WICANDRAFT_62091 [Wickerhamomyces anomalus NRRL Y-366-8]ODQ59508.1 hypothetical protein WICANDRAFT_62091 [Wickerhamomyces anomalus NRRL Y-366-8]